MPSSNNPFFRNQIVAKITKKWPGGHKKGGSSGLHIPYPIFQIVSNKFFIESQTYILYKLRSSMHKKLNFVIKWAGLAFHLSFTVSKVE